jgi:hypothetical protein
VNLSDEKLVVSLRDCLSNEAHKKGQNFEELLYHYAIRGFLDRLAHSPYRDRFVLKGGQVFAAWGVALCRPTRDIDLRGYLDNSVESMIQVMKEICHQPVEPPDGLVFASDQVTGEEIRDDADNQGIRILFRGYLGKSPIRMQIDIGFSDEITPETVWVNYPSVLGFPSPRLHGYPPETVIAEKLQAIVYLGEVNSRMKDFYDIWLLSRRFDFEGETLQKAITVTFQKRKTPIPSEIPMALRDEFAIQKQSMWVTGFLSKFMPEPGELHNFQQVVGQLRRFIMPLLKAIKAKEVFKKSWKAGSPWSKR